MAGNEDSFHTPEGERPVVYALVWRASASGPAHEAAFAERIPRLMAWLRALRAAGNLVGCGGGSFEDVAGGLTLIRARSVAEARELSAGTPMNEIGTTEILLWDVFLGDLSINTSWGRS